MDEQKPRRRLRDLSDAEVASEWAMIKDEIEQARREDGLTLGEFLKNPQFAGLPRDEEIPGLIFDEATGTHRPAPGVRIVLSDRDIDDENDE